MFLLKCCFTSTETVGLLGTGTQDGHLDLYHHLDFHTAPELWQVYILWPIPISETYDVSLPGVPFKVLQSAKLCLNFLKVKFCWRQFQSQAPFIHFSAIYIVHLEATNHCLTHLLPTTSLWKLRFQSDFRIIHQEMTRPIAFSLLCFLHSM